MEQLERNPGFYRLSKTRLETFRRVDCPYVPDLSYNGFGDRLRSRIESQRLPLNGSMELNFRCNLRCQHCYAAYGHAGIPGKQELSTLEFNVSWMKSRTKAACGCS